LDGQRHGMLAGAWAMGMAGTPRVDEGCTALVCVLMRVTLRSYTITPPPSIGIATNQGLLKKYSAYREREPWSNLIAVARYYARLMTACSFSMLFDRVAHHHMGPAAG
jgi:hypothetical protein